MKKCLAPCFKGCTDERYAEEADAVHAFLATRGESRTAELAAQRDEAPAELDFERAAEIHARSGESRSRRKPDAAGRPCAGAVERSDRPALSRGRSMFRCSCLTQGALMGPVPYSVVGMRHQNEQSGSSSLFAQPVALQPVPLDESGAPAVALASRDELESRLDEALAALEVAAASPQQTADHLSLFARWYYRPQAKRIGEVCFAEREVFPTQAKDASVGHLSKKAVLRAISRVYRASASSTDTSATSGPSGQSSA